MSNRAIGLTVGRVVLVVAGIMAVLALGGCAVTGASKASAATRASVDTPPAKNAVDRPARASEVGPTPVEVPLYTAHYKPNGSELAIITTKKGVIKFEFFPQDAPNTVAAFIELALKGFYDGTKFHRVVPGFVVRGGDPLSKTDDPMVGTGGPGYHLKAEFDPKTNSKTHVDGAVAMARSQHPDSAGSQFYITLGPQHGLDGQYTVFGRVIEGMDVVGTISVGDVMESVVIENATPGS